MFKTSIIKASKQKFTIEFLGVKENVSKTSLLFSLASLSGFARMSLRLKMTVISLIYLNMEKLFQIS